MAQQLIIQNDENEDYVQFTVEIPDGYNSFKVECINGTMINQNYLNIGDVIRFKFSNNPIVYQDVPYISLTDYTSSAGMKTNSSDTTPYNHLSLNLFQLYRIKFIPIYTYYSNDINQACYIFNPADESQCLSEPLTNIPDYEIQTNPSITVPFTGHYIIGLESCSNVEPIDIIIGESIDNSKTQPDIQTFDESGVEVPDNKTLSQGSRYNYGSTWRYNVSNLLINHQPTIHSIKHVINNKHLSYYVKHVATNTLYSTSYSRFNSQIISTTFRPYSTAPLFAAYVYNSLSQQFSPLPSNETYSFTSSRTRTINVIAVDNTPNPPEITHIVYNPNVPNVSGRFIEKGCDIIGSTLKQTASYQQYINHNDGGFDFQDIDVPIKDDVHYTGSGTKIHVKSINPANADLSNKTFTFKHFDIYKSVKLDGKTFEVILIEGSEYLVVFQGYDDKDRVKLFEQWCVLGRTVILDSSSSVHIIDTINTGDIQIYQNPNLSEDLLYSLDTDLNINMSQLVQLTSIQDDSITPADDDILLTHRQTNNDYIELSTPNLTNRTCLIRYDINESRYYITYENQVGFNNTAPRVFLPKKSNVSLLAFNNSIGNGVLKDGLMLLPNVLGPPCQDLNDEQSLLFLADGHESLTVEPPSQDDYKFKTFNASLTFDRSKTKITRLFSLSNADSTIGYLNDILSAKLSRYYFIANYEAFNTFFDTNTIMPLTNSINQIKQIYTNYENQFYTGNHNVLLACAGDIVKIIGSDTLTNNCIPQITPEEHIINCSNVVYDDIEDPDSPLTMSFRDFHYKVFKYYNSGFDSFPSIGGNTTTNTKGKVVYQIAAGLLSNNLTPTIPFTNDLVSNSVYTVMTTNEKCYKRLTMLPQDLKTSAYDDVLKWVQSLNSKPNNAIVDLYKEGQDDKGNKIPYYLGGLIGVLPCPRIYRNQNFEQPDLTISTGRIKTLSPVYIQSASRVCLNNLIYMFDMVISTILKKYGSIKNGSDVYDYLTVFKDNIIADIDVDETCIVRRFAQTELESGDYLALSMDSAFILNYLTAHRVNEYVDTSELESSLPTTDNIESNNEELIYDIQTFRSETNIQLFSSRYFNFHENISQLSMILTVQVINDTVELAFNDCVIYFGNYNTPTQDDPYYNIITGYQNNFYSNVLKNNAYNITRTIKMLIGKLGEYLDFPKIIFGSTLSFNQSKTVNIQYINPTEFKSEFKTNYNVNSETNMTTFEESFHPSQKQKNNVGLFGVVFKYHQLSLGWQQMINDIGDVFDVSRSKGQRHFIVRVYDEFGRQIPNMDTSQGFKNNLRLELALDV